MNQMNVSGLNPGAAGGPMAATAVPVMSNGSAIPRSSNEPTIGAGSPEGMINNLNTYIYDYFLKRGYHECARALIQDESIKLNTEPPIKASPGHREVNGVDSESIMSDVKVGDKLKVPDDLPRPSLPSEGQQSSFLLDWFSLFWDFFWAQRKKGNSNDVRQYLQHNQVCISHNATCARFLGLILMIATLEHDAIPRTAAQSIIPSAAHDARTDGSDPNASEHGSQSTKDGSAK